MFHILIFIDTLMYVDRCSRNKIDYLEHNMARPYMDT